jgi:hypothetical protein
MTPSSETMVDAMSFLMGRLHGLGDWAWAMIGRGVDPRRSSAPNRATG